jgi:histidyl-tRNA synthetase
MLEPFELDDKRTGEVIACIDKLERDPEAESRLEKILGRHRCESLLGWCARFPLQQAPEVEELLAACEDFGIGAFVEPDFKIVRGLAYYTGPVWEIFDTGRALRSVAGGGRYDDLIELMGGPSLPALGFGMGDVVLGQLLAERGLVPDPPARVEVVVVPVGEEMRGPARRVARRLRERGVSAETPYAPAKLLKAFQAAEAAGATRAVIVGPDEWAEDSVVVRDLAARGDRVVKLEDLE